MGTHHRNEPWRFAVVEGADGISAYLDMLDAWYAEHREDLDQQTYLRFLSLDVITINCPLHGGTEYLFDRKMLEKCKPGAFIVNTARGKIVDEYALADAVDSGHIGGYAGDVWFPQPAPRTHPWRLMPRHAMTPHCSGTTLDAQARYAAGVKSILEQYLNDKPIQPQEYVIIDPANNYSSPAYPDLRGMTKKN